MPEYKKMETQFQIRKIIKTCKNNFQIIAGVCIKPGTPTHRKPFTYLGRIKDPKVGGTYQAMGFPEQSDKYRNPDGSKRWQFKFNEAELIEDNHDEGVVQYLIKEAPGFGEVTARKFVEWFQTDSARRLSNQDTMNTDELSRFGLAASKQAGFRTWCDDNKLDHETKCKLYELGLTKWLVGKLVIWIKENSLASLKRDCFTLMQIDGIGFFKVSKIADAFGIAKDNPGRIKAGVLECISQLCTGEGHTRVDYSKLVNESCKLLNLPRGKVEPIFTELIEREYIVCDSEKMTRESFEDEELYEFAKSYISESNSDKKEPEVVS